MKWALRIIGAIAGALAVGLLVLIFMGMGTDADRMQGSMVIHRAPADVWPWLYEGDKLTQWVSWLKDVQRDPGPPQVGRTGIWTMQDANNGGMLMKINGTVEAVEPNRRFAMRLAASGGFSGTSEYRLVDLGGGSTRLETDARYHFDIWMARLFAPLIMAQARKKAVMDQEHLRALLEAGK